MKRKRTVSIASDDRARVPFGIIATILMVTSLVTITALQGQDSPQVDRQPTEEQLQRILDTTVDAAAKDAMVEAGQNPVTDPGDTDIGRALEERAESSDYQREADAIWHQYVKLLIYLNVKQTFDSAGEHSINGEQIEYDLPDLEDQSDIEAAIDSVTLEVDEGNPDEADLDAGEAQLDWVSVELEGVTVENDRGSPIANAFPGNSQELTGEAGFVSDVTVMHRQVQAYESGLERDIEAYVTGLMVGFGHLKGNVEWLVGGKTEPTAFPHIIEAQELEWWTNQRLAERQQRIFGDQEPRWERVERELDSAMVHHYIGSIVVQGGFAFGGGMLGTSGHVGGLGSAAIINAGPYYPSDFLSGMHLGELREATGDASAELGPVTHWDEEAAHGASTWDTWDEPRYSDAIIDDDDTDELAESIDSSAEEMDGDSYRTDAAVEFEEGVENADDIETGEDVWAAEVDQTENISINESADIVYNQIAAPTNDPAAHDEELEDVSEEAAENADEVYDTELELRDPIEGLHEDEHTRGELEDLREEIKETIEPIEDDKYTLSGTSAPYRELQQQLDEHRDDFYDEPVSCDVGVWCWRPGQRWLPFWHDENAIFEYYVDEIDAELQTYIDMHEEADEWFEEQMAEQGVDMDLEDAAELNREIQDAEDAEEFEEVISEMYDIEDESFERSADFEVRTAPVYMSQEPLTREMEPSIRPSNMGPEHNYNTYHVPMSTRTFSPLLAPGLPIVPFPPFWYLSTNVFYGEVRGEYARFELRSEYNVEDTDSVAVSSDGPSGTTHAYVREARPVYLELADGEIQRAGNVEPIDFEVQTAAPVMTPGYVPAKLMPIHNGNYGVGNRLTAYSTPEDCSEFYPQTGPDADPTDRGNCVEIPDEPAIAMHILSAGYHFYQAFKRSQFSRERITERSWRNTIEAEIKPNKVRRIYGSKDPVRVEHPSGDITNYYEQTVVDESTFEDIFGSYVPYASMKLRPGDLDETGEGGLLRHAMLTAFATESMVRDGVEDNIGAASAQSIDIGNGPFCYDDGDDGISCYDEDGEEIDDEKLPIHPAG